ncbi:unnamed protein product, partial [Didymodactylos carnosus]
MLIARFTQ